MNIEISSTTQTTNHQRREQKAKEKDNIATITNITQPIMSRQLTLVVC